MANRDTIWLVGLKGISSTEGDLAPARGMTSFESTKEVETETKDFYYYEKPVEETKISSIGGSFELNRVQGDPVNDMFYDNFYEAYFDTLVYKIKPDGTIEKGIARFTIENAGASGEASGDETISGNFKFLGNPDVVKPERAYFAVTVSITGGTVKEKNGALNPQNKTYVSKGGSITLNITPDTGKEIKTIAVDSEQVQDFALPFSVDNITKDTTITITCENKAV